MHTSVLRQFLLNYLLLPGLPLFFKFFSFCPTAIVVVLPILVAITTIQVSLRGIYTIQTGLLFFHGTSTALLTPFIATMALLVPLSRRKILFLYL